MKFLNPSKSKLIDNDNILRTGNSKSSVIVLYHGRFNIPPSSSSNALVQLSRSNQIVKTSHVSPSEVVNSASPDK